jgi:hypothetical protein
MLYTTHIDENENQLVPSKPENFIARWQRSSASERANYALFLSELCDFLDLPRPDPSQANEEANTYVIDKAVIFKNLDGSTTTNYIDLYKRNCFVLEAKQGSNPQFELPLTQVLQPPTRTKRGTAVRGTRSWDQAMLAARGQAERYAKALPASEGWPPFLITVDVGHSIELYADFSLTGKAYLPFPDPRTFRIQMNDLEHPAIRERLRAVWLDPHSLDPSRETARVTREVAEKLAVLARNLENHHAPKAVAEFLTRCIFTSFAEGVGLLPPRGWLNLLESLKDDVANFPPMAEALWQTMNHGGFSPILRSQILQFNGGLFESTKALPLTRDQLGLLIEAANSRWTDVEPAIFGTLLERAPRTRRAPRPRRPLHPARLRRAPRHPHPRRAAARRLAQRPGRHCPASQWRRNHRRYRDRPRLPRQLCNTRVLDPACGSGNFLYVALEHMKRLEGEVLETLDSLGESQAALEHTGFTVDPHQLLGIELNPRAAVIADLVLWIGYLQWHYRTRGNAQPPVPVIGNFHNIVEADALLTWKERVPASDADGRPITQWDGVTLKHHPTTGEEVPDEAARRQVYEYKEASRRPWPQAEFIIGNPPFIGARYIRHLLGDGYVEALREEYAEVPKTCDCVMYWWHLAAERVGTGGTRRFGFVTTNSISQPYSRRLIQIHLESGKNAIKLIYAIPDQPWVEASDGADVRVAMTVGCPASEPATPRVASVTTAPLKDIDDPSALEINEKTARRIGADLCAEDGQEDRVVTPLDSNRLCCFQGVVPAGDGFELLPSSLAPLGFTENDRPAVIRPYILGRDIAGLRQEKFIIDLFGLTEPQVQDAYPSIYQHLSDHVRPFRAENARAVYRDKWWIFAEPRPTLRRALHGLSRYIATPYTAKFRMFVFTETDVVPDAMAYAIALDDAFFLGCCHLRYISVGHCEAAEEWAWATIPAT